MNNLAQILKKFGESNKDIYSIITFGSFFHLDREKCSDSLSDLDLFLFTNDVKKYSNQNKTEWLSSFPNPVLSVYIQKGGGITNVTILFKNFFSIDITILDKKLLLLCKKYIQLKKFKVFNFLIKKGGRIDNQISKFSNYLSSGYKIAYGHDKIHPLINEITKNYRLARKEFTVADFKVNYNGFWQTCYKIYITIKKNDMLFGVLMRDNSLKRIIIEVLVWREQINTPKESAIFRGKNIKHWGNNYYSKMKNDDLMFTLNTKEAYSTLLKNILFYKSISKELSEWHLPELEKGIISLLENEIRVKSIQDEHLAQ
ncbi:aminoglycoside 6-adenylyltransferase [Tenacibaculum piscium]|uniref:aminoglycoside 6-adenylyltransferase n=1 Tax=Tenacibaculum piscium TaxID=1458515 RepID=UPI001F289023|nr:aminoglycoside 6-adenylyltransferase [Tenacibaculum piscium]